MKKISLFITFILTLLSTTSLAQSAMVQKVGKAVFSLTTFKADGSILATTHGVFCGNEGEAIASFSPFIGASSAVIIDASGKKSNVEAIIGANDIYDICRFKVDSKVAPVQPAAKAAKDKVFAVTFSTKKPAAKPLTIKSSEKFLDKYTYYVFNEEINDDIDGCPIVDASGNVIGLVQRSSTSYDIHSTDAAYYSELKTTGLSAHDQTLKKTGIRAALPQDHEQARLMLMMIEAQDDSLNVTGCINDYQKLYPAELDSYSALARYNVSRGNLDAAAKALDEAVANVTAKDEAYSEYAKQVYGVATFMPDSVECQWTLDLAEENISKAIEIKPEGAYRHQLAQIVYAKGEYQKAFAILEELGNGDMANSEVFYEMAQCKSHLGAENTEILPFIEKAVELCPKPITRINAPYIYARGVIYDEMGENKKALADYNLYDTLMSFRAPADFYYTRYKCETKLRQYQQALNDIAHAAVLAPGEILYIAELASLQLRVGMYEDVLKTCIVTERITQDYPDIYIIKGVALIKLERKDEAFEAFRKAAELGDPRGEQYLEKYK